MIIFCHIQSVFAIHKITIIIKKNIKHIKLHNNIENISFDTYFEKKSHSRYIRNRVLIHEYIPRNYLFLFNVYNITIDK